MKNKIMRNDLIKSNIEQDRNYDNYDYDNQFSQNNQYNQNNHNKYINQY